VSEIDISDYVLPTGTEGQMLYNNNGDWTAFDGMYWNDTSSRLGIGTTAPTNQLSIRGNSTNSTQGISVSNITPALTTASSGLKIEVNGDGTSSAMAHAIETIVSGTGPMLGGIYSTLTTGNSTLPGNGNQGLGGAFAAQAGATLASANVVGFDANIYTTNATATAYGVRVTDRSWTTAGNLYGVYVDLDDTDANTRYSIYVNSTNSPAYFGSNVGIGTTNPGTYKLNVAGSLIATDYYAGDGTIGATSVVSGLNFKDGLYTSGTLPPFLLTETGDISAVGSMTTGDVFNSTSASGQWLGMGLGNGRIQFIDSGTDYINVLDARLGIGTSTPAYTLDVSGTAQIQNLRLTSLPSSTSFNALVLSGSDVTTLDLSSYLANAGTQGQMIYNDGGAWTSFSGLYWDDNYLRLGISNTNPQYTLDVGGPGRIGDILLSSSSLGLTSDTDLIELENNAVTINGALTTTGAIIAPSSLNTINGLVINTGTITTGEWNGTAVTVPYGGTGATSLTDHGVLIGSGVGTVTALTPGTEGQVLIGRDGSDPIFGTLGGDIASLAISGTSATVTLANTGVVAGSYGTGTIIPQITVDTKGRVTNVSNIDISLSLLLPGTEGQMIYNDDGEWKPFSGMFWNDTSNYLGIGMSIPTHRLQLADHTTAAGGIALGSDVELYRSAANTLSLASGDAFSVLGGVVNLNSNANYATNINTGTSSGVVTIGGGSSPVSVNSDTWDISIGGGASGFTSLTSSGNISFSSLGAGGLVKAANGSGLLSVATPNVDYQAPLTFTNGLVNSSNSVTWGGDLTQDTSITQDGSESITFINNGAGNITFNLNATGDFNVTDGTNSAFFIKDDGNIGIGTTDPGYKLDINGGLRATNYYSADGTIGGTSNVAGMVFKNGLYTSGTIEILPPGTEGQMLYNNAGDWTATSGMFWDDTNSRLGIGTTAPTAPLSVAGTTSRISNDSGDLTITPFANLIISQGAVGIGTTNPSEALHVVGSARFTAIGSLSSAYDIGVTADGTLTTSTSDEALKTNIENMGSTLSKVMELNPISFNWINDPDGDTDVGFIAQEINEIFPEVTFINPTDGKMGVNYSRIPSILTKAIQEQQIIIQENQVRLEALEDIQDSQLSDISDVKSDVETIKSVLGLSDGVIESTESSAIDNMYSENLEIYNSIQTVYENIIDVFSTLGLRSEEGSLIVESSMNVMGETTLTDLTVTGDLMAGMIEIDTIENSIGVIGVPCYNPETGEIDQEMCEDQALYLQKESTGNLDVFDGKLVLEPDGTMKLAGSLEVEGTVKAQDVETTQIVIDSTQTESASAGKVTIPSGEKSIIVKTSAVNENSLIMVTPERPVLLGSKYLEDGEFEITLGDEEDSDLQVSWFILGSENISSNEEEETPELSIENTSESENPEDGDISLETTPEVGTESTTPEDIIGIQFTPEEEQAMALNP